MHEARIAALQGMPIFGGLRAEVLAALLEVAGTRAVPRDAFFFHEGDAADALYVLERGEVALLKRWAGEQYVLGRLRTGDCFGEMALLDLGPRSASVQAIEACSALALSSANLARLYETDVAQFALVQMNIARELSRRLRAADERLFRTRVGARHLEPEPGLLLT
ncbi:MAG: cyclic nucleotide-binding domain-containing protein [Burkholderiales bacterium]